MRVGVVSDTHGQVEYAQQAARMLESLDVEEVLHCGDIGSTKIPPVFDAWRTHYVFGNVDYNDAPLKQAIVEAGGICHGLFGDIELEGKRIALLHSHNERQFREVKTSGDYDLVCYGHTHVAEHHHEGDTLVLNPGALYRANPHSLAIVDLPELDVTQVEV